MSNTVDTVMVTGAAGFLGSAISERLEKTAEEGKFNLIKLCSPRTAPSGDCRGTDRTTERGTRVRTLFVDLNDQGSIYTEFCQLAYEKRLPCLVYHTAGDPRGGVKTKSSFTGNVNPTLNLLAAFDDVRDSLPAPKSWAANSGLGFVHISSISVHGCNERTGKRLVDHKDNYYCDTMYGTAKAASELIVNHYMHTGLIHPLVVRPCALMGGKANRGLLYDIVKNLYDDEQPVLRLRGDFPGSIKPYLHVDDLADALTDFGHIKRLLCGMLAPVMIASPPDTWCVNDIAVEAMRITGIQKPVEWVGDWEYEQKILAARPNYTHESGIGIRFRNSISDTLYDLDARFRYKKESRQVK